jgi:hypothetical protein
VAMFAELAPVANRWTLHTSITSVARDALTSS